MNINLIVYTITLFCSVFAVSGINFEKIIKSGSIWEVRFLVTLIILSLTYLSGTLIISVFNTL